MKNVRRIASFSVDHDFITPGIYVSRIDGDITTYDMRTRRPNCDDYMDNLTMHSLEHMFATYIRNSSIGVDVIYFGPMGCRTGFYLLVRDLDPDTVRAALQTVLKQTVAHEGEVFGATRKECGNYRELDILAAKHECAAFLEILKQHKGDYSYEQ